MLQVHITESPKYITNDEIYVRLPKEKFLQFDINICQCNNYIEKCLDEEDSLHDYIFKYYDDYEDIAKTSVRECLTTLTYILYIITDSIDEVVKKLNSLEIEEFVSSIICEDVIKEFRDLCIG